MDRRTALLASLGLCGLVPSALVRAQELVPRRRDDPSSTPRGDELIVEGVDGAPSETPADFPGQPGHQWRTYDISNYTRLAQGQMNNPQDAVVEWIFRRTGSAIWHGENVAVLSASRSRILAYHDTRTLQQVEEVIERFVDSVADLITLRVRIAAAADPRWRYAVYQRLTYHEGGPNGQQIWTAKVEDAALILTQMSVTQGFRLLADQEYQVINGQTLTIKATVDKDYVANLQRASAAGLGFQPGTRQISEGGLLRLSPLLNFEGDQIELAMDLRATRVRKLHPTKVIAPREVGPNEMTIDVPEVHESRINQTVPDWAIDRTLIVSAGILPGILQKDPSFLNVRIPGWTPGNTELLLFLDAKVATLPERPARDPDREDIETIGGVDRISRRDRSRFRPSVSTRRDEP